MAVEVTTVMEELARHADGALHYARLWKIERTDATVYRFTDHNAALEYDGEEYSPVNGMDSSAHRAAEQFDVRDFEARGIISDSAIDDDDLRAGKFRDAKITEYLVDWRRPWLGKFILRVYWLRESNFNSEFWRARFEGLGGRLTEPIGAYYTRNCQHPFGGTRCGIDAESYKSTGVSVVTVRSRLSFETGLTNADEYWNQGKVLWTSGDNDGLTFQVKKYRHDGATYNGRFYLYVPLPFNAQVGDTFTVWIGCGRTIEHCRGTSGSKGKPWADNSENFGGYKDMPGTDKLMITPNAK